MALAKDVIEGPKPAFGSAVSRRPLVIVASLFLGLGALATMLASDSNDRRPPEEEEQVLIVPDHASAERLRAMATQETSSDAPDNLGVTQEVPELPADALRGPASLLERQRAQYDEHVLQLQKEFLDSRLASRSASLRVASFEAALHKREQDAASFLEQMAGGGEGLGGLEGLNLAGAGPALAALAAGGGAAGGAGEPAGAMAGGQGLPDPNFNAAKRDFFRHGGQQLEPGRLAATVRKASSPYELQMGSIIPGVLLSGINSEAPGQITGQVSEHVYDSATGRHLLIPQGSRLVGTYSALIAQGQARVQVAWVRLNFPNGDKLDLGSTPGTDPAGTSGFHDRVNRHFAARLAAALMTSSLTIAYELTAPQNGQWIEGAVHRGLGESIVQLGTDMARQEGQRPPTLEIRPGYRFSIAVNKDIVFPGPYDDAVDRRRRRR